MDKDVFSFSSDVLDKISDLSGSILIDMRMDHDMLDDYFIYWLVYNIKNMHLSDEDTIHAIDLLIDYNKSDIPNKLAVKELPGLKELPIADESKNIIKTFFERYLESFNSCMEDIKKEKTI